LRFGRTTPLHRENFCMATRPPRHLTDSRLEQVARNLEAQRRADSARTAARHALDIQGHTADDGATRAMDELDVIRGELRAWAEEVEEERELIGRERARCEDLFDSAPDAYLMTDVSSVIRRANCAAGLLLGVEPRFLVGKPLANFVDENGRRAFRKQLDSLCGAELSEAWTFELRRRDHAVAIVEVTIARVRDLAPRSVELRWLLRDVTKQKRAEARIRQLNATLEQRVAERTRELEQVIAERDALLRTLSHDVRTPLQSVLAYAGLIELKTGETSPPEVREYVTRIGRSARKLLDVIDTLRAQPSTPGLSSVRQLQTGPLGANGATSRPAASD
jgi:PAS domain S-box-containing protein